MPTLFNKLAFTAALGFAVLLMTGCSYDSTLTAEELRERFSGNTVHGHHEVDNYEFRRYFDPAGEMRSYRGAAEVAKIAKWWINGDELCIRWRLGKEDLCRVVVDDGNGRLRKILRKADTAPTVFDIRLGMFGEIEGKPVVTYHQFIAGNPNTL
ncbi:MAG: hypothetical protein HOI95_24250 [Chromatiales bacterium]|jgi:hypothetical protein|nr:hypothetical protein [Chromatiales bacterium]